MNIGETVSKNNLSFLSSQINEIAQNITPEYWPHDIFNDLDRYKFVFPSHFYGNLKCLVATTDPYLDDDEFFALEQIERQYFRFILWLNNNPKISDEFNPLTDKADELVKKAIEQLSYVLYIILAPICYNIINYQRINSKKTHHEEKINEMKKEISAQFDDIYDTVIKIIDALPKENDIEDFVNTGFLIINEQG